MAMNSNEWNISTLHEHLSTLMAEMDKRNEQRFAAQEKAVQSALNSAKEAVLKAENAAEVRFKNTNEWRQTVEVLISGCFPKAEADRVIKNLEEKIGVNASLVSSLLAEKRGVHSGWGYAIGIIGVVMGIVAFLVKK